AVASGDENDSTKDEQGHEIRSFNKAHM
ncbi:MAG: hypothetical protein ACJAXE_002115, partial [Neolewinella sp.]